MSVNLVTLNSFAIYFPQCSGGRTHCALGGVFKFQDSDIHTKLYSYNDKILGLSAPLFPWIYHLCYNEKIRTIASSTLLHFISADTEVRYSCMVKQLNSWILIYYKSYLLAQHDNRQVNAGNSGPLKGCSKSSLSRNVAPETYEYINKVN